MTRAVGNLISALLSVALARAVVAQPSLPRDHYARGRVLGAGDAPIAGAVVAVRPSEGSDAASTVTDANGAFRVRLDTRFTSFVVTVRHPRHRVEERRITRMPGDTAAIVLLFRLTVEDRQLATVRVTAARPRPVADAVGRGLNPGESGVSALELGDEAGDVTGDLASALSLVPGLSVLPGVDASPSISHAGLGAHETRLELNGGTFGGDLPRDGGVLRVYLSSYDPGSAMSGARANYVFLEGTNVPVRRLRLTLDHPWLQQSARAGLQYGQPYWFPVLSGQIAGPIGVRGVRQSTTFQIGRRRQDVLTFASAPPTALEALGVPADSVARLLALLPPAGLERSGAVASPVRTLLDARLYSRFDLISGQVGEEMGERLAGRPIGLNYSLVPSDRTLYVVGGGSMREDDGVSLGLATAPTAGGATRSRSGLLQIVYSAYLRDVVRNETRSVLSVLDRRWTPRLLLPAASIQ
ncbi:MAG TPA: carboxypeptidase-like regulatory domain-containing protein, partial [Gemmatimonadaceae bacterium]|nr:carboxypeptidase-like regulatory domain-containing protein [Gemmatimonadaceae bacterium]